MSSRVRALQVYPTFRTGASRLEVVPVVVAVANLVDRARPEQGDTEHALDGSNEAERPYTVSERNYTIEILQPRGDNPHAVFFAHPRETVDFHYERKLYEVYGSISAPRTSSPRSVWLT